METNPCKDPQDFWSVLFNQLTPQSTVYAVDGEIWRRLRGCAAGSNDPVSEIIPSGQLAGKTTIGAVDGTGCSKLVQAIAKGTQLKVTGIVLRHALEAFDDGFLTISILPAIVDAMDVGSILAIVALAQPSPLFPLIRSTWTTSKLRSCFGQQWRHRPETVFSSETAEKQNDGTLAVVSRNIFIVRPR